MSGWMIMVQIIVIGCGATAVMDVGSLVQKRLGMAVLNYALVGRWAGHMLQGRFTHPAIAAAGPIRGEAALGWAIHYASGIAFAALLVAVQGEAWLRSPTLLPAVLTGVVTVLLPLLVMQPAMGAGFAASRTATPLKNCLRSLLMHLIFGGGLYLSASVIRLVLG